MTDVTRGYHIAGALRDLDECDRLALALGEELRRASDTRLIGLRAGWLLQAAYALYEDVAECDAATAERAALRLRARLERGIGPLPRRR
jgi:hypothetical protein